MKTVTLNKEGFDSLLELILEDFGVKSEEYKLLVRQTIGQRNILEEGLIKTEDYEKTIALIKRNIDLSKYRVLATPIERNNTYFIQYILYRYNADIINKLIKLMDLCGWFLSSIVYNGQNIGGDMNEFNKKYEKGPFGLCFDAKFDMEVFMKDLPDKLYHATNVKYAKKIIDDGLIPKAKSNISTYPSRVYLAYNKDDAYNFAKSKINENEIVIIELDVNRLRRGYKFMLDVNSDFNAVYTLEPIPYYALKIIDNE